jgi:hypothetical protein
MYHMQRFSTVNGWSRFMFGEVEWPIANANIDLEIFQKD